MKDKTVLPSVLDETPLLTKKKKKTECTQSVTLQCFIEY